MLKIRTCLKHVAALTVCFGVAASSVCAAETDPDGALYPPSDDQLAEVRQTLEQAEVNDRLALIVLGANWCHDSRALAARLNKSPLKEVIDENYELVLVNVGYYENGRDVVNQFGVHHYYATPTVLVVDPETNRLINAEDRHQWGSAYSISMGDSVEYFEKWPGEKGEPESTPVELQLLYEVIYRYEQQLADRVDAGYAVVGPMLKAYKDGNEPDEFDERWNELRDFRVEVPKQIRQMREDARLRVAAGDNESVFEFPDFPPLSWEQ